MAVELPEDAEGREIPLDTEILYDENGNEYEVYHYRYPVRRTIPQRGWQVVMMDYIVHGVSGLHLTPPDSRGKLKEDLKAVEGHGNYAHDIGKECAECRLYAGDRTVNMCKDIVSRIHKLGG